MAEDEDFSDIVAWEVHDLRGRFVSVHDTEEQAIRAAVIAAAYGSGRRVVQRGVVRAEIQPQ